MSTLSQIAWDDTVLPFQLDLPDVRGRVARLDGVLEQVLSQHDYPPVIEALVAEVALLTALIGQTMKLRWKLSLQIRGNGPIRIIATDYYAPASDGAPARIRGWASFDREALDLNGDGFTQIGDGYFAVLIDQGEGTTPYQGITPLTGGSLSACAQTYFAQSEQLPTRFSLAFGRSTLPGEGERWRAGGMMLQTMPKASPLMADAAPQGVRSVVIREVDAQARTLMIFTDARSPKVAQIAAQPRATLLAWSGALSWQLRLRVRLDVQTSGLAVSSRWARLKLSPAAQDYQSPLPPARITVSLNS